jgi:hypothetical protein
MNYTEILINLGIGLVAGIYAGVVVARISKFEELKNEAKRIVWDIDFMSVNNSSPKLIKRSDTAKFLAISSELYFLKHNKAGNGINDLSRAIDSVFRKPPEHSNDIDIYYSTWQKVIRELRPNMLSVLSLNVFSV